MNFFLEALFPQILKKEVAGEGVMKEFRSPKICYGEGKAGPCPRQPGKGGVTLPWSRQESPCGVLHETWALFTPSARGFSGTEEEHRLDGIRSDQELLQSLVWPDLEGNLNFSRVQSLFVLPG